MDFEGIDILKDDLYEDSHEGDAAWLQAQFEIKSMLGLDKLPDLQGILFAIGLQELGQLRDEFSKEERQDLMHIAVCRLLSYDGYFELEGYDADGQSLGSHTPWQVIWQLARSTFGRQYSSWARVLCSTTLRRP